VTVIRKLTVSGFKSEIHPIVKFQSISQLRYTDEFIRALSMCVHTTSAVHPTPPHSTIDYTLESTAVGRCELGMCKQPTASSAQLARVKFQSGARDCTIVSMSTAVPQTQPSVTVVGATRHVASRHVAL